LSRQLLRCFLSRLMSQRPPCLLFSSSHIGLMPSWDKFKKNSHKFWANRSKRRTFLIGRRLVGNFAPATTGARPLFFL
jgi:hypothetical protein